MGQSEQEEMYPIFLTKREIIAVNGSILEKQRGLLKTIEGTEDQVKKQQARDFYNLLIDVMEKFNNVVSEEQ